MKTKIKHIVTKIIFWIVSFFPFHIEGQSSSRNFFLDQRNLMAKNMENGEFGKIKLSIIIYDRYQEESIEFNLLMIWEQELMLLVNGDYKELLWVISYNESRYYHSRNNRTYLIGYRYKEAPYKYAEQQKGDRFNKAILNFLEINRTRIEMEINHSDLTEEQKAYLIFYVRLSIHYNELCEGLTQDLVREAANGFMKRFSNSDYAPFIRKYGSFKAYQSDWTFGLNIAPLGIGLPINRAFGSKLGVVGNFIHAGASASYKNIFMQVSGGLSGMTIIGKDQLYTNYELRDNSGITGDITIGYNFHLNNFNHTISPFVGMMYTNLSSAIMKPGYISHEHNFNDFNVGSLKINNRAPFIGVNFDFNRNISTFCNNQQLGSRNFHRLQIGFTSKSVPFGDNLSENNYLFFRWTYGIDRRTERRVPNF